MKGIDLLCLFFVVFQVDGAIDLGLVGDNSINYVSWGLTDFNKTRTCILLSGFFEFEIPYMTDYGARSLAQISIPVNSTVNGFCDRPGDPNVEAMTLSWEPEGHNDLGFQHNVTFTFRRRGTADGPNIFVDPFYELSTIEATIFSNPYDFPDAFQNEKVYELKASSVGLLSAPETLSYYCKSTLLLEFDDGGVNTLAMSHVHAEAFHNDIALGDGQDFGPRSFCSKDGVEVILMVLTYVVILSLIGLAIFYIVDRRSKREYIYL